MVVPSSNVALRISLILSGFWLVSVPIIFNWFLMDYEAALVLPYRNRKGYQHQKKRILCSENAARVLGISKTYDVSKGIVGCLLPPYEFTKDLEHITARQMANTKTFEYQLARFTHPKVQHTSTSLHHSCKETRTMVLAPARRNVTEWSFNIPAWKMGFKPTNKHIDL